VNLNNKLILNIVGIACVIMGGTMLVGLFAAFVAGEQKMIYVFGRLFFILFLAGGATYTFTKSEKQIIKIRDGMLAVALVWVVCCVLGALPYMMSGTLTSFIDAFFESSSSLTTTGATILTNINELPKSLIFWRLFTNWLGGIGILIFAISILPMLGMGASNLANAETSGQSIEKIRSRMSDSAKSVYLLYVALTVLAIILLKTIGRLSFYDSVICAFGSIGNGGFTNHDNGLLAFDSLSVEIIIMVFCLLGSLSFVTYQLLLKRRVKEFLKDREFRLYMKIIAVFTVLVLVILFLNGTYETIGETIRYGVFQVISFATTAGYSGTDYNAWPAATHWLLLMIMVVGGCSGSTSGGIKVIRLAVILSLIRRNIYRKVHPNAVVAVRVGNKPVSGDKVSSILTFILVYIMVAAFAGVVLSLDNLDMETTLSTVLSMLSNNGLALGAIGFSDSYQIFSHFSRFVLTALMLAGRLELFSVVMLFTPAFWRPDK
jgi:trk system potassium uptake protein TrkH